MASACCFVKAPSVDVGSGLFQVSTAACLRFCPSCLLSCPHVQGQWQVVFGKCSRLTQTQPSQAFESWYQTRLANQEQCEWPEDLSQVITHCSIPSLPSTTIRQVRKPDGVFSA
jgi:hypothetical protein